MKREEGVMIKNRKVRSDKKRDVKPTISVELKNCIYRLSYITDTPVKDVTEIICSKGLQSRKVIEHLSHYFRREYQFMSTIYLGDLGRESLQRKYQSGKNERITTRFEQTTYEEIKSLSDALDVTPSKATALLLDASVRNTNLLNAFVKTYLHETIDKNRMKELKQVLHYVNKNNPYNEDISWFTLLSMIYEEVKDGTVNVKEAINNWVDKFK
ncbi:hypothetical protein [Heyndrickxia sporothermodurans]|uniref:hypothetical protein n=1 Tax=Heyndrickxia sporothermodurans TaxID=46224 RepID=UPI000D391CB5|nr:hypothetical protein [Heyndrickxia sporothermodurans]PTY92343.1 hypothetical protein B5V90_03545 [Heyndrickxia sporothermodurans]